jgi:hypothetical protein
MLCPAAIGRFGRRTFYGSVKKMAVVEVWPGLAIIVGRTSSGLAVICESSRRIRQMPTKSRSTLRAHWIA